MIKSPYKDWLKKDLLHFFENKNVKVFLFGSALRSSHFGDVDVGIEGEVSQEEVIRMKEYFENSRLPYKVDIVNFNKVQPYFRENVFANKVEWIQH